MTDDQKKKLREFADTGGTLFFEAGCGSLAGKTFLEGLVKDLWPERTLKLLDNDSRGRTPRTPA